MKKLSLLIFLLIVFSVFSYFVPDNNSNDLLVEKINQILAEPNLGYDLCYRRKGGSTYSTNYFLISWERENITSVGITYSKTDSHNIKSTTILTCAPITGSPENGWVIENESSYKYILDNDNHKVYSYKNGEISKEYFIDDINTGIKYLKYAINNRTYDVKYKTLTGRDYVEE